MCRVALASRADADPCHRTAQLGGAIYSERGLELRLTANTTLAHSNAIFGGCLYVFESVVYAADILFDACAASESGGAAYVEGTVTTMDRSVVRDSAANLGG